MARKFGIAVVGCGRWGSHYVRILDQDPDVGVLTVYDEREDRLQAIVRRSSCRSVGARAADGSAAAPWRGRRARSAASSSGPW